jgi:hypothetical protein
MARPIKETPILSGKDAERFLAAMERAKTHKESEELSARRKKTTKS